MRSHSHRPLRTAPIESPSPRPFASLKAALATTSAGSSGRRPAAPEQVQLVQRGCARHWNRHEAADRRLGKAGYVEGDVEHDSRIDGADAPERGDPGRNLGGRPLQMRKHVPEAVLGIVAIAGATQEAVHAPKRHEQRHAAGDDSNDGGELPPVVPSVAAQLPVEWAHHWLLVTSRDRRDDVWWHCGPLRRCARSAFAAPGPRVGQSAHCV